VSGGGIGCKAVGDLSTLVVHYHDVIISLHYDFENAQVWLGRIHVHAQNDIMSARLLRLISLYVRV